MILRPITTADVEDESIEYDDNEPITLTEFQHSVRRVLDSVWIWP